MVVRLFVVLLNLMQLVLFHLICLFRAVFALVLLNLFIFARFSRNPDIWCKTVNFHYCP